MRMLALINHQPKSQKLLILNNLNEQVTGDSNVLY